MVLQINCFNIHHAFFPLLPSLHSLREWIFHAYLYNCYLINQIFVPEMFFLLYFVGPAAFYGCCGFYNLGNTCFMNAGLQCLFCNTHLVKFFHEQFVLNDVSKDTLTGKFCQLVRKVWSGNFSLIHPLDFKGTLGMYYPQFHDFRQVSSKLPHVGFW